MKQKLIFLFFALLPFLGFSQKPTTRDTNNLEQMIDEFLDYHILKEIFQVRRLSNITEGMLVSDGGNLPLGDFANYFYQQTKIGIRIRSYVEKDHLWSNLNKKDYQQSQKEDNGLYLQIDVKLEPQELIESKGYRHKLTIEIKPSLLLEQTKQIPQDRYDAMNAFLRDSIGTEIIGPTRDRLNSAVIGALMILVGAADFPVYATLTPTKGFNSQDKIPNIALQNQYHSVVINSKQQFFPYYSVQSNQSINVDATIKKMLIDTVAKPIRITGSNGFQKELKSSDTASSFSISGMPAGAYTVSANMQSKSFEVPLAGFDLAVYDKQDITVKLIPLGVNKADVTGLSNLLKNLYKQAVIECNTSVDEVFTTDAFKDKLEVGDNSIFSNYSSQMNDIIRDYKKDNPIDKKTYYIFVVPRFSQTAVQGYMPMKRQFGFVALQKTADFTSLILAHELGHGAFCLEHPEKEFGVTLHFNLMSKVMDFPSGGFRQDKLTKYQWDQAHDPPGGMFLFQEEEDVMAIAQAVQCLSAVVVDFTLYYTVTWLSIYFDDAVNTKPGFTDFSTITSNSEFSWTEAGISAGISCGSAILPSFVNPAQAQKFATGMAALGGALAGMSTEAGKQYDLAEARLKNKTGKSAGISDVVKEMSWEPVVVSAGLTAAITATATYIATSPKYTALVTKIKQKLGISDIVKEKQKLIDYVTKKNIFKIGDEIAGIKIERIKQGTNGKYIVIGRNMESRVQVVAKKINAEFWTGFNDKLSVAENVTNNRAWLKSKLSDGYNVIDIGLDPYYTSLGDFNRGAYYSMELFEVFGIK